MTLTTVYLNENLCRNEGHLNTHNGVKMHAFWQRGAEEECLISTGAKT